MNKIYLTQTAKELLLRLETASIDRIDLRSNPSVGTQVALHQLKREGYIDMTETDQDTYLAVSITTSGREYIQFNPTLTNPVDADFTEMQIEDIGYRKRNRRIEKAVMWCAIAVAIVGVLGFFLRNIFDIFKC